MGSGNEQKQDSIHLLRPGHVLLAAEALAEIFRAAKPADSILQELFRQRGNAGSKDRAKISGLVYGVLRNYFPLRAMLGDTAQPLALCAAQLLRAGAAPPALRELDALMLAEQVARFDENLLSPAQRHNLPPWLWDRLLRDFGEVQAAALAQALNQPATVDLRVNTIKASREAAQQQLAQEKIPSLLTPLSPFGLRLHKRAALQTTRAFRDGLIEPQDEGSQLLALHLNPLAGETVADFCAGAGGKTLALGALMQNQGALHAFDINRARLARLEPRLRRSGLTIVQAHLLRDEHDPLLENFRVSFDAVLVDAPCSASGTLRRNPELRLREPDLARLQALQRSILAAAAKRVRAGGRLVYATCSVLREENEDVVQGFLACHGNFARGAELRLLPHRDSTDGFYAVTLRRNP